MRYSVVSAAELHVPTVTIASRCMASSQQRVQHRCVIATSDMVRESAADAIQKEHW